MPEAADQLLSRKQAADYLGVKPQTLASWTCTRRYNLPVIKVGRLVKYRRRDLDEWLACRTQTTPAEQALP